MLYKYSSCIALNSKQRTTAALPLNVFDTIDKVSDRIDEKTIETEQSVWEGGREGTGG